MNDNLLGNNPLNAPAILAVGILADVKLTEDNLNDFKTSDPLMVTMGGGDNILSVDQSTTTLVVPPSAIGPLEKRFFSINSFDEKTDGANFLIKVYYT